MRQFLVMVTLLATGVFFGMSAFGQNRVRTPEEEAAREAKRAADDARRHEIPLGGNFKPKPEAPAIVAITHGMRLVLSKDDGKTWKQVFFGAPAGDHGYWASKSVAYTNGVFVGFAGWGAGGHGSFIASEDGVNWRHLTNKARDGRWDAYGMNDTMGGAGGKGVFVTVGTSFETTPDFGKTWRRFSPREFEPPVRTHHMIPVYGDYEGGRFLVLGDGPNIFYSKDLGQTWVHSPRTGWGEVTGEGQFKFLPRGLAYGNGTFVVILGEGGATARCSTDGGETWSVHPTGAERVSNSCLSFVNGEFWLTGQKSRASKDGKTWRDLPPSTPVGKMIATDQGTYLCVYKKSGKIVRSTDGQTWSEVFALSPEEMSTGGGAQGFSDIAFGYINATPVTLGQPAK